MATAWSPSRRTGTSRSRRSAVRVGDPNTWDLSADELEPQLAFSGRPRRVARCIPEGVVLTHQVDEVNDDPLAGVGDTSPHGTRDRGLRHLDRVVHDVQIVVVVPDVGGGDIDDGRVEQQRVVFDGEVVPAGEEHHGGRLSFVVAHVVGVYQQFAVFAGQQLGGTVGEQGGHGKRGRAVGGLGGHEVVGVLVGGEHHGQPAGDGASTGGHACERLQRHDRLPRLDVDRVLGRCCGVPGGEVVDVVEDEAAVGQCLPHFVDQARKGGGDIDGGPVGCARVLWVAVLIQVEAVEADRVDRGGEIGGEVCQPLRGCRVEDEEEVAERVGFACRAEKRMLLPVGPFVRPDGVHRRVSV